MTNSLHTKNEQAKNFNLWTCPPDRDLQSFDQIQDYLRRGQMRWRRTTDGVYEDLKIADTSNANDHPLRDVNALPKNLYYQKVQGRFSEEIADASTSALYRRNPDQSAAKLFSPTQRFIVASVITAFGVALWIAPIATLICANILATAYFLCAIGFRMILLIMSLSVHDETLAHKPVTYPATDDVDLPIITILLPLHDETESVIVLAEAIRALDYPPEKLDIKVLLEQGDDATRLEVQRLALHKEWDLILVPPGHPQTKPKACNHGLYAAHGDLIVIYDAEDQPEPDQLRKAAAVFQAADDTIACVQARLNFYNTNENWITRLFALEYALWFDSLLPALEKLNVPIPLGGTSNFFRTDILHAIGGWDPYNVTEDADLGLRLAAMGYRTQILDSTTFEEANCDITNWMRQRSRWMKGYIQTWFVHMRKPRTFIKSTGMGGFLATQLFVGGNVFSALINPFLWIGFLAWHLTALPLVSDLFPGPLLWLNLFALLFGNFFFIYLSIIAPLKRGWAALCPHAVLMPVYWSLTAIAAYRAVWQLFSRPHYWEKTDHMLSPIARQRRIDMIKSTTKMAGDKG